MFFQHFCKIKYSVEALSEQGKLQLEGIAEVYNKI